MFNNKQKHIFCLFQPYLCSICLSKQMSKIFKYFTFATYNVIAPTNFNMDSKNCLIQDRISFKDCDINVYKVKMNAQDASKLENYTDVFVEPDDKLFFNESNKYYDVKNEPNKSKIFEQEKQTPFSNLILFTEKNTILWNLYFLSGTRNAFYQPKTKINDVTVFVLDTGVNKNHPEFTNVNIDGFNVIDNSTNFKDDNGHGTHVAGTIVGNTTGVVGDIASLHAIKVLDKKGKGEMFNLYKAIFKIVQYKVKHKTTNVVVNISIAGKKEKLLNKLINIVAKKFNIHFVTAAGNSNKNSCKYSPGSSCVSVNVGAINKSLKRPIFNNNGNCVDIYAPGKDIKSANYLFGSSYFITHKTHKYLSGTSMAAPHVTGVMATYLLYANFTPLELKHKILEDAEVISSFLENGKVKLVKMVSLYNLLRRFEQNKVITINSDTNPTPSQKELKT